MIERAHIDGDKQCSCCLGISHISNFHRDRKSKDGHTYYCKNCANAKTRAHHQKHGDNLEYRKRKWNSYYKRNYGITLSERRALLEQQGFLCAICSVPLSESGSNTHTDHCHQTGKVRGMLCTNCNRALGHFQESETILKAAIEYLQAHTVNGTQKEGTGQ